MFAIGSFFAALRERRAARGALAEGLRAIESGRFDDASAALRVALAQAQSERDRARVHNKLGVACVAANRRDDAIDAFASALQCDPGCAPALVNVGNLLLEDGHVADALDHYEAALVADAGYALAYRNLGVALRRVGRVRESVTALRKADRLEVRPPRGRA